LFCRFEKELCSVFRTARVLRTLLRTKRKTSAIERTPEIPDDVHLA